VFAEPPESEPDVIRAFVFDLDGTLVASELLKATSYARAIHDFDERVPEEAVFLAYREVVGLARETVARHLVERFHLEETLRAEGTGSGADEPWQRLVDVRLAHYDGMLSDDELIRANRYPHALDLLDAARRNSCRIGLVTTSDRVRALRVLSALGIEGEFAVVVSADDVENTKPDPEGYFRAFRALGVEGFECLALEDSLAGIRAATAAGAFVVAVPPEFTREHVRDMNSLDPRWVVERPDDLPVVVGRALAAAGAN
jgi:HAD superfamily hydrolase (TIGR01509 family)